MANWTQKIELKRHVCPVCKCIVENRHRVYCSHKHKIKAYRMRRAQKRIHLRKTKS